MDDGASTPLDGTLLPSRRYQTLSGQVLDLDLSPAEDAFLAEKTHIYTVRTMHTSGPARRERPRRATFVDAAVFLIGVIGGCSGRRLAVDSGRRRGTLHEQSECTTLSTQYSVSDPGPTGSWSIEEMLTSIGEGRQCRWIQTGDEFTLGIQPSSDQRSVVAFQMFDGHHGYCRTSASFWLHLVMTGSSFAEELTVPGEVVVGAAEPYFASDFLLESSSFPPDGEEGVRESTIRIRGANIDSDGFVGTIGVDVFGPDSLLLSGECRAAQ